jgi:hypothetical protein
VGVSEQFGESSIRSSMRTRITQAGPAIKIRAAARGVSP